jgi:HSP20 family protein
MANLTRFDPFADMLSLREAMNQLLEESFVSPTRSGAGATNANMPLNVSETEDAFIIEAVVPGVKPEDLDITLQDNVLTLTAETRQEQQTGDKQANFHRVERRYGRVSRTVGLPTQVKPDAVKATLENGVLHLEIPKAEEVKPRKITVTANSGQASQVIDVSSEGEQQQPAK